MKNKIMMILLTLLLISTVSALENTTTSSVLGTESASVSLTLNETATSNVYIATDTGFSNIVDSYTFPTNDSTFTFGTSILTGNTKYYYKFNGTTEGAETQTYSTVVGNFTTNQYGIPNAGARLILGVFTLLFIGFFLLRYSVDIISQYGVKKGIMIITTVVMGAFVIQQIINAVLLG